MSVAVSANIPSHTEQLQLIRIIGDVLYVLGSGLMILVGHDTPTAQMIGFSVITGITAGLFFQPALMAGPMSVQLDQMAGTSSFLSFLHTLRGMFATALLTSVFEMSFSMTLKRGGVVPVITSGPPPLQSTPIQDLLGLYISTDVSTYEVLTGWKFPAAHGDSPFSSTILGDSPEPYFIQLEKCIYP